MRHTTALRLWSLDRLESRLCLANQVPIPRLDVDPVTLGGGTDYDFVVAFAGNHLLDHGSLDSNDILITGPNGFSQKASLLQVMPGGFTTWAQYRIAAPGGSWDVSDNGTYAVSILPDAIFDNSGKLVVEPGVIEVYAGDSSKAELTKSFTVTG